MKHYVITRLTCGLYDNKRVNNYVVDGSLDTYLKKRLWLCKHFTLASLRYQNNQNFEWLLILDPSTPEHHKEMIREEIVFDRLRWIWSDHHMRPKIDVPNNTDVIMTRIDSDDMLSRTYIDMVQAHAKLSKPLTIIDSSMLFFISSDLKRYRSRNLEEVRSRKPRFVSTACSMTRGRGQSNHIYEHPHERLAQHYENLLVYTGLVAGRIVHDVHLSPVADNFTNWSKPITDSVQQKFKEIFDCDTVDC